MNKFQKMLARFLVRAFYGGLLGWSLALLTGNSALAGALAVAAAATVAGLLAVTAFFDASVNAILDVSAIANMTTGGTVVSIIAIAVIAVIMPMAATVVMTAVMAAAAVATVAGAVSATLDVIAHRKGITPEAMIDEHVVWLFALVTGLFQLSSQFVSNLVKPLTKPQEKKEAWDKSLIIFLAHELASVYPEDWNNWQHWISDILESRQRLQARRINHRLVSLITCYWLFGFSWHIGIEKVFVITMRRATSK